MVVNGKAVRLTVEILADNFPPIEEINSSPPPRPLSQSHQLAKTTPQLLRPARPAVKTFTY